MNDRRNFCVFDFETGGANTNRCEILQIGACIINPNSLAIIDQFTSLVRPNNFDALEEKALEVNRLTIPELENAPPMDSVFDIWAKWIQKYNIYSNKSSFGAPMPVGWGITTFDIPIMNRYCEKYGYWDGKWNNGTLLNPVFMWDVMHTVYRYVRNNPDVDNVKLATIAEYMGVPKEEIVAQAHDALWDVMTAARIAIKFLRLEQYLLSASDTGRPRLQLKGCLKR
jgi:DNA polymerase III epsilon subunit-like protein